MLNHTPDCFQNNMQFKSNEFYYDINKTFTQFIKLESSIRI